jgi:hypothetical protein
MATYVSNSVRLTVVSHQINLLEHDDHHYLAPVIFVILVMGYVAAFGLSVFPDVSHRLVVLYQCLIGSHPLFRVRLAVLGGSN